MYCSCFYSYSWKSRTLQSEWFTDQQKVRETVGLTASEDSPLQNDSGTGLVQCESAYCDEVDKKEAHALNCGHWFCNR